MYLKYIIIQVLLPGFVALGVGWLLVLIGFARLHQVDVIDFPGSIQYVAIGVTS